MTRMSWADLVREYFPDADDEMCDYILWERTCYPIGSLEQVKHQLQALSTNIKSFGVKCERCHELEKAIQRHRQIRCGDSKVANSRVDQTLYNALDLDKSCVRKLKDGGVE